MKLKLQTISVAVVLSMMAVLTACSKQDAQGTEQAATQNMPPATVDVQTVTLQPIPVIKSFSGRVAAIETSDVRPQVSGIIDEVLFKEGSQVQKGQELYRINRDNYVSAANSSMAAIQVAESSLVSAQAALAAQQATLEQARSDLARVESLVGIDAVSQQLYDQYQTAVKTAQANVESAKATVNQAQASINSAKASYDASRLDMSRTVIRAPISGKIGISSVTTGALVSASQATPLVTIARTDAVYVDISQSSSEMLRLRQQFAQGEARQGSPQVQIVLEDGETYPLIGRLALSDAKVDEATGAITIRAVFPNPDGLLIPGMYVNANLAQAIAPQATLLPQSAVMRSPTGDTKVYVVDADKKIADRAVKIQGTYQGQWVVTEGLNDGDVVVIIGGNKVKVGQTVEPRALPPTSSQNNNTKDNANTPPQSANEQAKPIGQGSVLAPSNSQAVTQEQSEAEAMADDVAQTQDNK